MQEVTIPTTSRGAARGQSARRQGGRRPRNLGFWRRHKYFRGAAVALLVALFMGVAGVGSGFIVLASFQVGLPSVADLPNLGPPQDSYLLSSNGTLLSVLHEPGAQHINVALADVSSWLVKATISVEDRHFYQDTSSVDLPRILESAYHDVHSHGSLQGASTITEQLAKISFLTPNQTFSRKVRELLLGYEISRSFSSDQILQMYVNRIPYGNQAIGVGTASELYFHIPANKLDLAQASMLAGIPDAPTAYDPLNYVGATGPNYSKLRQRVVLDAMVSTHDITQAQANAAYKEPLTYYPWEDSSPDLAPDFVTYVTGQLQQQFGDAYLNPGGWTIYTSLNMTNQNQAQSVLQNPATNAQLLRDYNIGDSSLVSLDPRDGEILAMVGTNNYNGPVGQVNMTTEPRRPGSSFKLYTYTAAIASGKFTMTTPILDAPIDIDGYSPQDYEKYFSGICELQKCLGNSINVPAVKVELLTGIPSIVSLAERMGASLLLDPQNTYGAALTLGGLSLGLTELQVTTGASVIASGGVLHEPTSIVRVVRGSKTVYQYNVASNSIQVVPPDVAFIMNAMLSNNENRIMDFGADSHLTLPGRPVSAKTGTSDAQSSSGAYSNNIEDNWTFGWTPQIVTGVWVGNPDGATLSSVSSGITGAAPLWQQYMEEALTGQPVVWYQKPADVVQVGAGPYPNYYLPNTVNEAYQEVACPAAYENDWNGSC
jgi:penicillin-binding protein 1A